MRSAVVLLFLGSGCGCCIKWSDALNCWMVLAGVASILFLLLYSNGLSGTLST